MSGGTDSSYFVHSLLRAWAWQPRPQLDDVCQWWRGGGRGVLALVGMGGAGKTAIAERLDLPSRCHFPSEHRAYVQQVADVLDRSHLVGKGVFRLWRDPEAFGRISIGTGGEVRWSDEVDLCADALYLEITGKQPNEVFPSLRKAPVHA